VTDKVYQDFDLRFEWKISRAGNSGLFINVQERPELVTTFSTGPEYQLLDDKNVAPDYLKNPTQKAAAIFGVIPNTAILCKVRRMEPIAYPSAKRKGDILVERHTTVEVDLESADWKNLVAHSSLSKYLNSALPSSDTLLSRTGPTA